MSPDMVEVVIDSIRVSLMSQQRILILRERDTERYLPIWIGVYEAESITIALQEVEVARPLTHDLIKNIFREFKASVLRVEVVSLHDDTFFGNIVAEINNQEINIDSRPSDALAIAVRLHIPILVHRDVMDNAGIIPEENIQTDTKSSPKEETPPQNQQESEGNEDRLSIFQDFFEKLDLNNLDSDDPEEKP
jgi:uncharacterized protein